MANRMTVKVKHVPLPKNKNKKLLQKENVSENFSFMHPKEMNPQNYEKQYKSYLEKKKKMF